jgi:hemerythrin-like domain-containing protein
MNPIEKLMAEHQNIIKGLDLLERGAAQLEKGDEVSPAFFNNMVDFIRDYADKYHHAKEENILFVRMSEIGFSPEMGPVGVMLNEHSQGRSYVSELAKAIERYAAGDGTAIPDIVRNARGYANLLRLHIHKEDTILYPMAENALGETGIALMRPDFEEVEREKAGVEEKYIKLLDSLECEKFGAAS